jgi:hypothetical protein
VLPAERLAGDNDEERGRFQPRIAGDASLCGELEYRGSESWFIQWLIESAAR